MTLEQLENYRGLVAEVNLLSQQIENLYNTYHSPSFSSSGSFNGEAKSPVEDAVKKIMSLDAEYLKKKNQMSDEAMHIENWLNTVDDVYIRASIRCHYMLGYTWKETSGKVYGYEDYYNARKAVYRYFGRE